MMKINYLSHNQIDKTAWDRCIAKAVNGKIYGYSWYLDVVCEQWDALVMEEYKAVFPLPFKEKFGISFLYQPFFTQQLGIFSTRHLTPEVVNNFLEAIPKKFIFGQLNLNKLNEPLVKRWEISQQVNHELDLIEDYEKIYAGYSENTRRNINKARKHKLIISPGVKPEEIVTLFRGNRGKYIPHLKDNNYKRLLRLIYQCQHNGKAMMYGVYDEQNTLCAGAVMVFSHHKVVFLFSAISETGRKQGAMFRLIDEFIRERSGNHLTLDFEGSNDVSLARFYKGFGATRLYYPAIQFNRMPFPVNKLFDALIALKRK